MLWLPALSHWRCQEGCGALQANSSFFHSSADQQEKLVVC